MELGFFIKHFSEERKELNKNIRKDFKWRVPKYNSIHLIHIEKNMSAPLQSIHNVEIPTWTR